MKEDITNEINMFKAHTPFLKCTPAEWKRLSAACLDKFGNLDKFKDWQRKKLIVIE